MSPYLLSGTTRHGWSSTPHLPRLAAAATTAVCQAPAPLLLCPPPLAVAAADQQMRCCRPFVYSDLRPRPRRPRRKPPCSLCSPSLPSRAPASVRLQRATETSPCPLTASASCVGRARPNCLPSSSWAEPMAGIQPPGDNGGGSDLRARTPEGASSENARRPGSGSARCSALGWALGSLPLRHQDGGDRREGATTTMQHLLCA
uniref:Uncharacterized protein n=1 Tax=Triticum urartu TaxID=4572 RepID=A0A8R7V1M5_TRIUA